MGREGRASRAETWGLLPWLTAAALTLAALAAAAQAQVATLLDPAPPDDGKAVWVRAAGAGFGELQSDTTPIELDFFDVAFRNQQHGLAGGARCREDLPSQEGESAKDYGERLDSCERVPEIWRYTEDKSGKGTWARQQLEGAERKGYVGSIAWIRSGRALAVGGDGAYPRREPNATEESFESRAESDLTKGAGRARAWLYDPSQFGDEGWHELDDLPAEMRGLSALDVRRDMEWGAAGGLGQVWKWENGSFAGEPIDRTNIARFRESPTPPDTQQPDPPEGVPLLELRIRDVKTPTVSGQRDVLAVTAGCCDEDGPATPQLVRYSSATGKWTVRQWSVTANPMRPPGGGVFSGQAGGGIAAAAGGDSVYALTVRSEGSLDLTDGSTNYRWSGVRAPGGPERPDEPASRSTVPSSRLVAGDGDTEKPSGHGTPPGNGIADWEVGELRAADEGMVGQGLVHTTLPDPPDGRRQFAPLLGCFVKVSSNGVEGGDDRIEDYSTGHALPGTQAHTQVVPLGCLLPRAGQPPASQVNPDALTRPAWDPPGPAFAVDSYALNAVDMLGSGADGWAAGDRGALLQFGDWLDGDPEPPRLGAGRAGLPDSTPYDGARPPVPEGAIGEVPARIELRPKPGEALEPLSYGSPEPDHPQSKPPEAATTIVMSRDGTEGWAIGPFGNGAFPSFRSDAQLTLYHFDGDRWSRCDPRGAGERFPPDEACASLLPLLDYRDTRTSAPKPNPAKLYAAARVPLEHDDDPGNDDEFELVAMGVHSRSGLSSPDCRMLRYRDGRWAKEPDEVERSLNPEQQTQGCPGQSFQSGYDLEFTAPDDGWLVTHSDNGNQPRVYRYDGGGWIHCQGITSLGFANQRECGNQGAEGQRLPLNRVGVRQDALRGLVRAGRRLYMFGARRPSTAGGTAGGLAELRADPFIVYRDPGDCKDAKATDGCWRASEGGFDPGIGSEPLLRPPKPPPVGQENADQLADQLTQPVYEPADLSGQVLSLSVALTAQGYRGWAAGKFERDPRSGGDPQLVADAATLRLEDGSWTAWTKRDAALDYVSPSNPVFPASQPLLMPRSLLTLPERAPGGWEAVMALRTVGGGSSYMHLLGFNAERQRWEALRPNPLKAATDAISFDPGNRRFVGVAPDGAGGFWLATATRAAGSASSERGANTWFHRFGAATPPEVFRDVPHPVSASRFTSLAASPGGTVWLGGTSSTLFRYDRLTGWDKVTVPGWDAGRIVTRASSVGAVAVGPRGEGLAVGEEGRIARLGQATVSLDPAAGRVCDAGAAQAPCGTSKDLETVAIAPDGSALAGGERRALLWRPAGGGFRAAAKPPTAVSATITGIALPRPDRAWLSTDRGQVYVGTLSGDQWSWELENVDADGDLLSLDESLAPENAHSLRAIAVGADGRGLAVGERGLVLERTGDGELPWRRLDSGVRDNLTAVTLAPRGQGALVGGEHGLILTRRGGRLLIARGADRFRPLREVVRGLALVPGQHEGQVEAFAAISESDPPAGQGGVHARAGANSLLHYSSDPEDALLDGAADVEPLPDAPPARPGELRFAAFGKSDCPIDPLNGAACPSYAASNRPVDRILDKMVAELRARADLDFAVHTGDAYESGGEPVSGATGHDTYAPVVANTDRGPFESGPVRYRRFVEGIVDPLRERGIPTFGAIGGQDVSDQQACAITTGLCAPVTTKDQVKAGLNLGWREGFGQAPAPWGHAKGETVGSQSLEFRAVRDRGGPGAGSREVEHRKGHPHARTHYAVDVSDGERKLVRLVFVDNSLRSLSAGDAVQNPLEADAGGQLAWLERMVCVQGTTPAGGGRCTRERGQRAVVVATTPTYSYGPGTATDIATDGAQMESRLIRHGVSAVVSGRLGWNGRYWATAPGVHEPCPGSGYQETAPEPGTRVCGRGADTVPDAPPAADAVAEGLRGLGAPASAEETQQKADEATGEVDATGLLPFVVAASAGGDFGPDGRSSGEASDGFWRGYSVVRLDPSGDPRGLVVEQRPVLDWIAITAQERVLRPGQRMTLRGVGREPIGIEQSLTTALPRPPRYNRIDSPAITHRYDLVEADPAKPHLPRKDPDGDYVPLDPTVATVDSQTGKIRAGRGNHPRVYAVAILSVGKRAAAYPLVFEPRRSFRPKPAVSLPALPLPKVAASAAAALQSPQAPPPVNPPTPQVNVPAPPVIPSLPTPSANPPAPPAPPAPPPPPVSPTATPLDLVTSAVGLNVAPQATVIPPPAPPIQPAPPGGARREARQRQAATQKSGADGGEGSEIQSLGGDLADSVSGPEGVKMTARDRQRPAPSITPLPPNHPRPAPSITRPDPTSPHHPFTSVTNTTHPSTWPRTALYTGALTLLAALLALSWLTAHPRPRRRPPAAPAWNRPRPR